MFGVRCGRVVCLVARITVGRCSGVTRCVAVGAGDRCVRARKREICQIVIEIGRSPRCGVVTEHAVGREPGGGMIGICRSRVILLMASDTRGSRTRVPGRMATVAGDFDMRAREWK